MENIYVAIGHFKDEQKCMKILVCLDTTKANCHKNLQGNAFLACAVLTEKKVNEILVADVFTRWEMVKKLTSNYRKWMELDELFEQCGDIFLKKIEAAKAENNSQY